MFHQVPTTKSVVHQKYEGTLGLQSGVALVRRASGVKQDYCTSLSNIVTSYLQHQHSSCRTPIVTCPPFSLLTSALLLPLSLSHSCSAASLRVVVIPRPLPSTGHHRSNANCLEGKGENYQVCPVQYCVQQLCTLQCTHMNGPNSSLEWVLSHCEVGLVGLKPILRTTTSFSVLTLSVGSFDP